MVSTAVKKKPVHHRVRRAQFTACGMDTHGAAREVRLSPRRIKASCPACVAVLGAKGLLRG